MKQWLTLLAALAALTPRLSGDVILVSELFATSAQSSDSNGNSQAYSFTQEYAPPVNATYSTSAGGPGYFASASVAGTFTKQSIDLKAFGSAGFMFPEADSVNSNAQASLSVLFDVDSWTTVHITGYRDRALWGSWQYTLIGPDGPVALNFTSPAYYLNYMDESVALAPGRYTLTGGTEIGVAGWHSSQDDSYVRLNLNLSVPDGGQSALLLGLGLVGLGAFQLLYRDRCRLNNPLGQP